MPQQSSSPQMSSHVPTAMPGGAIGPVRGPDRRRDLHQEGGDQRRPQAGPAGLFGDPDYLLRVVAADLNEYAALRDHELASLPSILWITSTIVMKRLVDNRPLPLPAAGGRARSS